ncbi:MAG: hypothetical protein GTO18_07950 [Anaerolineales bacterium]|nr:hypothetical protein [Anaerolineales bacterium]
MRISQTFSGQNFDALKLAGRLLIALITAGFVAAIGISIFFFGTRILYPREALPGVYAAGLSLTGMDAREIEAALDETITYPDEGLIVFYDNERPWTASPSELGVSIDTAAMAYRAVAVGRQGSILNQLSEQLDAWFSGRAITSQLVFDEQIAGEYLSKISQEIDKPLIEAKFTLDGVRVVNHPGQIGRALNIDATIDELEEPISLLHDAQVDLIVEELPPLVLDASAQAALVEVMLSEPLVLTTEGAGPWLIEPETLAAMLQFNLIEDGLSAEYGISIEPTQLTEFLGSMIAELNRGAENARFIFNDDTGELDLLQSHVVGRSLNISETILQIQEELNEGIHEVALVFDYVEPDVKSDATAVELGISEPVSVVSSYFSGSSTARGHNIATAAAAFHGLLIAPGETLSMAEVLGDISLDTGYAEALIIYGDRTIEGVGGGVCQVSTTLFRTAFFGGYPIVERYPHAYRVGYYEQGRNSPGPGLDATVFVPLVDFKFTNDRPYYLLLETYIYGNQLVWKIYSTSDGREVDWNKSESNKVEAPDPLYKENSDLPKGEIRQVDWEADGLDVTVWRTVTLDGEVLFEDIFETHYQPWRAIYEYGPGTELPEDAKTE